MSQVVINLVQEEGPTTAKLLRRNHGSTDWWNNQVALHGRADNGSTIYDVHKEIILLTPYPVHMRPHETDPSPLWMYTCRRQAITHHSLETAGTITLRT